MPRTSSAEMPRESALRHGAKHLKTSDLLALCLGSGQAGECVFDMASRLLAEFGTLDALISAPVHRLLACRGLGKAQVARLKAIHEIACRQDEACMLKSPAILDHAHARRYIRRQLGGYERELFGCLFLDTRHRVIAWEVLFKGSVNRAHIFPREVLKRGLELNAAALVLAHNHPSGLAEPSAADITLTKTLKELLHQVDIEVLDHFIVTATDEVSLAARGLIGG